MPRSPSRRVSLALSAAVLGWAQLGGAAPPTSRLGSETSFILDRAHVRTLASASTGASYRLYVSLPHSYEGDATASHGVLERRDHYPVIYLLDADYAFLLARNITDHLAERDDLPEVILVGVANDGPASYRLHRTRDYTPTFVPGGGYGAEYQRHSGGGPRFLEFLEKELVPLIERSYRATTEDRTIVGHSFGGLFASFALLEKARLFQRVIAVSPSLWYDDRYLFRRERAVSEATTRLPARFYLAVGSREGSRARPMVPDLEAFAEQVRSRGYDGLELRAEVLTNETHNSVFPRALSNGLRWVFGSR